MSAWPLTSCTRGGASLLTRTSMNSSDFTDGGGGVVGVVGVSQLSCSFLIIPAGTSAWLPSMLGQTSVGGVGVTQLPCSFLIIPAGTSAWLPSMLGQTSVGGGGLHGPR